jgi:hypothetical protein
LTEATRAIFPDVVAGIFDPDELGAVTSASGEVIDVQPYREAAAPEPTLSLSPHADSREEGVGDDDLYGDLVIKLERVKVVDIPACDSYDKALAIRNVIGSMKMQSELTCRIQAGKESGALTAAMSGELGKLWQHCHRQVTKLEEKLKPSLESSFADEPAAEEQPRERQPGEDDD